MTLRLGSCLAAIAAVLFVLSGCTATSRLAAATSPPPSKSSAASASSVSATPSPTTGPSVEPVAAEITAARAMLAVLPIGGRGPKTGYNRTAVFGPAWVDVDGNGCDTRDDILARDLTNVRRRGSCTVESGTLADPYTGRSMRFTKSAATAVQVDHVFPLGLAWQLGAAQWSLGERVTFANDPANLVAVDGPANERKSESGPDSWLPPNKSYRCTYVIHFVRVATLYTLRITPSMRAAVNAGLDACTTVVGDPAGLKALPSSDWQRAATLAAPAPLTTTSGVRSSGSSTTTAQPVYYPNCAAARAAGAAPLRRGDPGYRAGLDRDGDGIACE